MIDRKFRVAVFEKAALCRNFEEEAFRRIKSKDITFPAYLSAGQEYIPATLSHILGHKKPLIFAQHRAHSTYLCFGGKIEELIDELLGKPSGCAHGMGGSASIQSPTINMYGHDGHMGTQVPIAVGACYSSNKPTLAVMGDASAEEDYVLGALGWASTKNLPILFVVEDNNLSILTEKKVRRNWEMSDVAKSFKMDGFNISDDPIEIKQHCEMAFKKPTLLNINTNRLFWHAGAGQDFPEGFDRYKHEMEMIGDEAVEIHETYKNRVKKIWLQRLERQ